MEVITVERVRRVGPWSDRTCVLRRRDPLSLCTQSRGYTAEKAAVCKLGRGLNGTEFSGALILDFLLPEPCANNFLVCKLPSCGVVFRWPEQTYPVPGRDSCPRAAVVLKTRVLLGIRGGTWDSYQFRSQTVWGNFTFSQSALSCFINLPRAQPYIGEGNGTPLQYSCLENPMDGGAWWAAVHGVTKSRARLSDFTFTFHFPALEKEMATHSSVLAWRIPGTGEPGGLPSKGSHRVRHDWSDLAAAAALYIKKYIYSWNFL